MPSARSAEGASTTIHGHPAAGRRGIPVHVSLATDHLRGAEGGVYNLFSIFSSALFRYL